MQLIEHNAVDVKAVLTVGFCGKYLVEAVGRHIDDSFLRGKNLDSFG